MVEDFATEARFKPSGVLISHGAVSGLSVVIEGREEPFGVLSAHSTARREFCREEIDFLTTFANVLSAAVGRHRDEQASRHAALHDPLTGLPNRVLAPTVSCSGSAAAAATEPTWPSWSSISTASN